MTAREAVRSVALFADLPDADIERLCEGSSVVELDGGEIVFAEGDTGDAAYVITAGELEVVKAAGAREILLAVRGPGDVVGEMALLDAAPRMATVRARGATSLVSIPKQRMDELLAGSATAARALFGVLLNRWRETESRLRQSERMAQLGTLTAGLAHELNNPAAAVRRGADQLRAAVDRHAALVGRVDALDLDDDAHGAYVELSTPGESVPALSAVERSDRESDIGDALERLGVDQPWEAAASLVAAGAAPASVDRAAELLGDSAATVLAASASSVEIHGLLREVEEGAARLSAIVGALKSYSYLDQAPVQDVDVHRGIEDTLLILKGKLTDIAIVRDYDPGLPLIEAYGSELNQVWTNLIDNAADALADADEAPQIILRTRPGDGTVVVEVEDNGPGIPPDVQKRIFDAFFTTKPPGSGTGLGLDIVYSIVVHRHGGDIEVESEPGRTVFRVSLPVSGGA